MLLSEFDYELPKELIAQTPIEPRDHSKLLVLSKSRGTLKDAFFYDIGEELWPNDVLVLNSTKVINARLKWKIDGVSKEVEVFLHKKVSENSFDCLIYPWKKFKIWTTITFWDSLEWTVKEVSHSWRIVTFNIWGEAFFSAIEKIWEVPLPPYIKEKSEPSRYQTVYSQEKGSVAAPTAWLHFTEELLEKLKEKGVLIEKVTLHVGLWTFKWVEVEDITHHTMHTEWCSISQVVSERLNTYKSQGKRIIAVWTTSVRTLESFCWDDGVLTFWDTETQIFIYPGYTWKFVDAIITNFHLPKSTLLMLVSSFAGKENIKKAYQHGIDQKYRFFSFWDAMFLKD